MKLNKSEATFTVTFFLLLQKQQYCNLNFFLCSLIMSDHVDIFFLESSNYSKHMSFFSSLIDIKSCAYILEIKKIK